MCSDELNLETGIWTIPAWRSKNGHAHRVPLTDMAVRDSSARLKAAASTEFLFPGYGKDDAIKSSSVGKAVRRYRTKIGLPHWTAHDLQAHGSDRDGRSRRRASCDRPRPESSRGDGGERHGPGL